MIGNKAGYTANISRGRLGRVGNVRFHTFQLNHHRPTDAVYVEQGRIRGNPVADGWAGAVMRKPLVIQKCDLPTFQLSDQHGKV